MERKPRKTERVDHIWIALRETMPRMPANSVFNLKPAGAPINQAQLDRIDLYVISPVKFITHQQADSALNNSAQPIKFPKRTSRAKLDHMECLRNAAFSAYSTHDRDLKKRIKNAVDELRKIGTYCKQWIQPKNNKNSSQFKWYSFKVL